MESYILVYLAHSIIKHARVRTHVPVESVSHTETINCFDVTSGIKYAIQFPLREESADTEGRTCVSEIYPHLLT